MNFPPNKTAAVEKIEFKMKNMRKTKKSTQINSHTYIFTIVNLKVCNTNNNE